MSFVRIPQKEQFSLVDHLLSSNPVLPIIEKLFNKHFPISDEKFEYVLPEPDRIFVARPWETTSLQVIKTCLNDVKNCLNNFELDDWQFHTQQMNIAGNVLRTVKRYIKPEFITQAWCKFYEIACNFPLVPLDKINHNGFSSVHLCEAPGAFVVALNHWLKSNAFSVQWDWMASTLNPYCEENSYSEMIYDDRFIQHTLKNWCFGASTNNTGNLMNLQNLNALVEKSANLKGPVMLVTADGSIDCTDVPSEQESAVAYLHLCETITCMHLLEKGGNFLLKIFTLFEQQSVCLMYLLSCIFHKVTVTKPGTSKAGNSEMYVVCLDFKGKDYVAQYLTIFRKQYNYITYTYPPKAMFDLIDISSSYFKKIEDCCNFFKRHQCEVIQDNVVAYETNRFIYRNILLKLNDVKEEVATYYLTMYKLKSINPVDEIVGQSIIKNSNNCIMTGKIRHDSYNERCRMRNLSIQDRLYKMRDELQVIESIETSYTLRPQTLLEVLEIQMGKSFKKIRSSRFCEARILQILNEVDDILQKSSLRIIFPDTENVEKDLQLNNPESKLLSFHPFCVYNSYHIILEIYNQITELHSGQTLILIGYPLLTQFSIGLLYILGSIFNKISVNINTHHNEGYYVKLEIYQLGNKTILDYLCKILRMSLEANEKDMSVWSIMPVEILYKWDQYPVIVKLNHLMIKLYIDYIINVFKKIED